MAGPIRRLAVARFGSTFRKLCPCYRSPFGEGASVEVYVVDEEIDGGSDGIHLDMDGVYLL
jgi:hypothetical protein